MSYQVLARKWRPKRFSEMVGQQHVLKALENALNQDRLHHAYLFTGTRGVGKTTIARIFAKCINCESGVSAEPCGTCSVCESVDQGRFLDLMEIDAASHTGVDSIRELLENTQYTPTHGKYKVYLIDEVHMLSSSSFNALLKTLEEPPEHVKFLLATTDPQKLPVTVLSRCLQFNLKAMSANQISEHLKVLLEKEMISFEEEALTLIAQSADGSMRDALSLCDQAIAHGNESLNAKEVRSMLGLVDRAYVTQLMEGLASKDAKNLLEIVEKISLDSPSYKSVLAELISYMHRLIIQQVLDADTDAKIKELAQSFTAEELQLYYQVALKGREDLAISPDPKEGMEICLLRMLLFRPEKLITPNSNSNTGSNSDTNTNGERGTAPANTSNLSGKAAFDSLKADIQKKKPSELSHTETSSVQEKVAEQEISPQTLKDTSNLDTEALNSSESAQAKAIDENPSTQAPLNQGDDRFSYKSIPDKWTQIVLDLKLSGPALMVAKNSNFEKLGAKQFRLRFDKKFELLATEHARAALHAAVNSYFGAELALEFEMASLSNPTPEQLCAALDIEKSKFAEQSIREDDTVKVLLDEFGAKIQEGSAKLLH